MFSPSLYNEAVPKSVYTDIDSLSLLVYFRMYKSHRSKYIIKE